MTTPNKQFWTQNVFPQGADEEDDRFGYSLATADFDGDGYNDLAIGAIFEDLDGKNSTGKVNVLKGSSVGLTSTGSQLWKQGAFPEGADEDYDFFGRALAVGDFNGDGYYGLAIGTPHEELNGIKNAGKVNVLKGSSAGLTSTGSQLWKQGAFPEGGDEPNDYFGETLAVGDFNGDGYDDLAIGTPKEDYDGHLNTGKVNILKGSSDGLTSTDSQFWTQSVFPQGVNEEGDRFGSSLATGDFNGDGYDDLAIGSPFEDYDGQSNTGKVNILKGSSDGLTSTDSQFWTQSVFPQGGNEKDDFFGSSLAVGDFNGDGYDDLVIGSPSEELDGKEDAGKVNILKGSSVGLTGSDSELWTRNDLIGNSNGFDRFGEVLATGDFNNDGYDDLAVTTLDESEVNVIYGSISGLTTAGKQVLYQSNFDISNDNLYIDYHKFGWSLTVEDFNGDGYDDLAIGYPQKDIGDIKDSGAVSIAYGSTNGLVV